MTEINAFKDRLKGLYAITDQQLITEENFSESIEATLQGGTRVIQYRDKSNDQDKRLQQARMLRALCHQYHAICIINDDIELAKAVNAHGVHLGKDDFSLT
ncbi:MAG: thiamine phosphate synthase, partial [Gammaproteobacteria bacterium]